jgi:hypothetical protein
MALELFKCSAASGCRIVRAESSSKGAQGKETVSAKARGEEIGGQE